MPLTVPPGEEKHAAPSYPEPRTQSPGVDESWLRGVETVLPGGGERCEIFARRISGARARFPRPGPQRPDAKSTHKSGSPLSIRPASRGARMEPLDSPPRLAWCGHPCLPLAYPVDFNRHSRAQLPQKSIIKACALCGASRIPVRTPKRDAPSGTRGAPDRLSKGQLPGSFWPLPGLLGSNRCDYQRRIVSNRSYPQDLLFWVGEQKCNAPSEVAHVDLLRPLPSINVPYRCLW